jgi:hypothetical protein
MDPFVKWHPLSLKILGQITVQKLLVNGEKRRSGCRHSHGHQRHAEGDSHGTAPTGNDLTNLNDFSMKAKNFKCFGGPQQGCSGRKLRRGENRYDGALYSEINAKTPV